MIKLFLLKYFHIREARLVAIKKEMGQPGKPLDLFWEDRQVMKMSAFTTKEREKALNKFVKNIILVKDDKIKGDKSKTIERFVNQLYDVLMH